LAKRKKNYRKTEFLRTWKILQKNLFLKKIFGNFLMQEFYTFLKSAQNSTLKKFFSTLIRDGAAFLEVKSSNKIETDQYFKKTLFYKLVLGFQGRTKIT
jgi:hypothetical protein